MIYNDFPILDTANYSLLNDEYQKVMRYSFNTAINSLSAHLNNCKQLSFNPAFDTNKKLIDAVNFARQQVELVEENIRLTFATAQQPTHEVREFDVFGLLGEMLCSIEELSKIEKNEQRLYIKNSASKNMETLLAGAKRIVLALGECKIKIFKYL